VIRLRQQIDERWFQVAQLGVTLTALEEKAVEKNEPNVLLLELEKSFPPRYREYYAIKRQNFFAGVTQFPEFWGCYMRLDDIFTDEFDDLRKGLDPRKGIPLMLFAHAHAQFRIFLELAFTGCFCEAFNIARMAIESAYQARKILVEPELLSVWLRKDRDKKSSNEFDQKFDFNKRKNYEALGLAKLHTYWRRFSLWSHPSITALNQRFTPEGVMYFETDLTRLGFNLFDVLWVAYKIENALFDGFEPRLRFDDKLEKKRKEFDRVANRTRLEFIKKFKIQPPASPPGFPYS
jgi:hypothetical protein